MNEKNTQGKKGIKVTLLIAVVAIIAGVFCGACAGKTSQDAKETVVAEAYLAENTSVEESIAEETVVEETATEEIVVEEATEVATTEDEVEEVNPEDFPLLEGDFDFISMAVDWMGKNTVVQCTETDYLTGEEKYIEYLFNRDTNVFSSINEGNLLYATMAGNESVAYVQNEDNTTFYKVTDCKEAVMFFNTAQQILIQNWMTGEFTFTEGSDGVNGEYIYAYQQFQNEEGTETYKVSYFIDKETNLPFMQVISTTMPATGEETVVKEAKFMYAYLDETSVDWDNFKTATTLPSEDEVVEVR